MPTKLALSYAVANVFQQWWYGQGDPLYAVLSRRGYSTDWVTVEASEAEVDRLMETAKDIIRDDRSEPGELRTAQAFLDQIGEPWTMLD